MRRNNEFEGCMIAAAVIVSIIIGVGNISLTAAKVLLCAVCTYGLIFGLIFFIGYIREKKRVEKEKHLKEQALIESKAKSLAKAKLKRYNLLTKEDFICLEGDLSDKEMEKICIDAFKAGNRCAIKPLFNVSARIIKGLSPWEVIKECDAITALIPNSRTYYEKGIALQKMNRLDEAIVELENAIKIAQVGELPELRPYSRDNLVAAQEDLSKIQARARRMHIEKEGAFNLVKTGTEYEKFICGIIRRQGVSCKRVGQAGDYGADIIANLKKGTLVIQCKFYSKPVGYGAVQQAYTAKSIYNGTWCCVVTNATFTRQAIEGGKKLGVRLLSHVDFAEYVKSLT